MCKVREFFNKFLIINFISFNSFGHSCYGGFGKRSNTPLTLDLSQDIVDTTQQQQQQSGPLMKMFPQPTQSRSEQQQQQQFLEQQEKEFKLIVLSTMSQVVDETLKKITAEFEK